MKRMKVPKMLPWIKPDYLNLDWSQSNSLPTPYASVPVREAVREVYCINECLLGIGFDQCEIHDEWFNVHYRFFRSRAYAVALRFMSKEEAESRVRESGGEAWPCDFMPGYAHYVIAFRIGCTHPKLRDRWTKMYERVQVCPDCGYSASFDTSG